MSIILKSLRHSRVQKHQLLNGKMYQHVSLINKGIFTVRFFNEIMNLNNFVKNDKNCHILQKNNELEHLMSNDKQALLCVYYNTGIIERHYRAGITV
jgi:hypothetical protein